MGETTPRDRAAAGFSTFLQRLPMGKAKQVAQEMGIGDKEVSELKTQSMEKCILLLAHLGLKVVDVKSRCISPAAYDFLVETHERVLRTQPSLVWDEQE